MFCGCEGVPEEGALDVGCEFGRACCAGAYVKGFRLIGWRDKEMKGNSRGKGGRQIVRPALPHSRIVLEPVKVG